ncbi:BatD family protein [Gammaproteobacteria bacterium]|nr:BatD family protein [Gammaproteobacteria bacterium]
MVNRSIVKLFLASCMLLTSLLAVSQTETQALSAFVDRNDISLNELLTLTIRIDNSLGNARPSLAGLNRDFEQIGNVSTRSSYTNINGTVQSFVDYIVQLRARSAGTLTIPSFRIGGEVSSPIAISVGEADQLSNSGSDEIFIVSDVSKETVYVQEQLLYTIKLYYSISFDQGAQLTSPQVADAVVQQLGSDETYSEIVDGVRYNVTERKFVIFPQSSGELTIPPVYFTATVGRRGGLTRFFNNRTTVREINLASDLHAIEVLGKPPSFTGQTWLPAANIAIIESWSGPVDDLSIGESVTRNIQISASGLSSSLLPGISYADLPGLKFYPDQPSSEDSANELGVTGSRTEGTAIVPSEAGDFVIPEVVIPWWNTTTDALERAVIPARTLTVKPGATGSQSFSSNLPNIPLNQPVLDTASALPATQTSGLYLFWITTTAVFAVAWFFSTAMWLRSRRLLAFVSTATPGMMPQQKQRKQDKPASVDANMALKVLKTAIDKGKAADIRHCLIAWGQAFYEDETLLTLSQLAQRANSDELNVLLKQLEQSLYSNNTGDSQEKGPMNHKALLSIISSVHKKGAAKGKVKNDYSLPPLYKN